MGQVSQAFDVARARRETPGCETVAHLIARLVQCGIVSFTCGGVEGAEVERRLRADNINSSFSPHRYARIDIEDRGLAEIICASVHYYNTEAELDRACELLATL